MDRQSQTHPEDLAAAQHGLITRRQLTAFKVSAGVIERRLRSGALIPVDTGSIDCVGLPNLQTSV